MKCGLVMHRFIHEGDEPYEGSYACAGVFIVFLSMVGLWCRLSSVKRLTEYIRKRLATRWNQRARLLWDVIRREDALHGRRPA